MRHNINESVCDMINLLISNTFVSMLQMSQFSVLFSVPSETCSYDTTEDIMSCDLCSTDVITQTADVEICVSVIEFFSHPLNQLNNVFTHP